MFCQTSQLFAYRWKTISIAGIHYKHHGVRILKIIVPKLTYLILTANVPSNKRQIAEFNMFTVETDRRDRNHVIAEL